MGENFLLIDDNACPHRADVVDTFLQNHTIARMNWPARSPDLNPIEHFDILKASTIQKFISNERINWHFIPPSAPNFGGIWEAGIKSFKFHLLRCLKSQILTFEELRTLTTQIEACLNSRHICPLSSDSDDFNSLTPGHFLIGRPLTAPPESNDDDVPINYLDRWSLNKKIKNVFWKCWNREYLNNWQQRLKWQKSSPNIKEDVLILLKDTISPPAMYWSLGRITKVFPGADGKVRVVEVKTKHQERLTRTVSKIVPLPFAEDKTENTKFNYLIAQLDPKYVENLWDIITSKEINKYSEAKERLLRIFKDGESKRIRKLPSGIELGDLKPSQLLQKLISLATEDLSDKFIKTLWLEKLPQAIQQILIISEEELDKLAVMAERIAELNTKTEIYEAAKPDNETKMLFKKIESLEQKIESMKMERQGRSRDRRSRDYHYNARSRSRSKGGYNPRGKF
ncbi:hypothetical protein LAZ67_6003319 [Cordylochernes scorpioides]|uniref:DUF5641 domain-containing protein n=1 Tax=Cordylochernes scorpioides TaxID=51811 RepID=A0ABY6KME1_9ARAC|nr:hypothetical protein LAZ67_6003319 [Cordylochernes scorpioides]